MSCRRVAIVLLLAVLACYAVAFAAPQTAERIVIPATSTLYRIKLEREVAARFGDTSPAARIAAQAHQESRWEATAKSRYAEGMLQFTPGTSAWIPSVCPELGPPDPWDANWSMRAAVCYDHWLLAHVGDADSECDRWAFALSAYNGGIGWVQRDKQRASAKGADPTRWFENVEAHSARAGWALKENRGYVRRILLVIEPVYLAAGWPGVAVCP